MRPPERIDEILKLIHQIWRFHPQMRFFQLIYVLQSEYCDAYHPNGVVKSQEHDGYERTGFDLFCVEDIELIAFLNQHLQHLKR